MVGTHAGDPIRHPLMQLIRVVVPCIASVERSGLQRPRRTVPQDADWHVRDAARATPCTSLAPLGRQVAVPIILRRVPSTDAADEAVGRAGQTCGQVPGAGNHAGLRRHHEAGADARIHTDATSAGHEHVRAVPLHEQRGVARKLVDQLLGNVFRGCECSVPGTRARWCGVRGCDYPVPVHDAHVVLLAERTGHDVEEPGVRRVLVGRAVPHHGGLVHVAQKELITHRGRTDAGGVCVHEVRPAA